MDLEDYDDTSSNLQEMAEVESDLDMADISTSDVGTRSPSTHSLQHRPIAGSSVAFDDFVFRTPADTMLLLQDEVDSRFLHSVDIRQSADRLSRPRLDNTDHHAITIYSFPTFLPPNHSTSFKTTTPSSNSGQSFQPNTPPCTSASPPSSPSRFFGDFRSQPREPASSLLGKQACGTNTKIGC